MNNDLFNLIRFVMLLLAIISFVIMCIMDESRDYPVHTDPPYMEPTEIESI